MDSQNYWLSPIKMRDGRLAPKQVGDGRLISSQNRWEMGVCPQNR